ncbi:MAG: serine/threonine protein kinase [Kofleriaceae bacterium]|nr:serine/threonine protein kinase [Kofleriaceae bacterium]
MFVCSQCGESKVDAGFCPSDGMALADNRADPFLGSLVGSYRVASLLGIGGMGRVYKGVNPSIGSRVAIKVLNQDSAQNPELVERFFAEARAVNLIRHEGIVNIIDLTVLPDRRPCIVMEYLDGAPLSSIMRGGASLPLGSFLKSMVEVLSALAAAHHRSVVHRDLKPDNIVVSPQGKATILDFGIAKLSLADSGRSGPTREGSVLGTPRYMSPEQAAGRHVDHRSDIYSIGIVLFEGVLGQSPFTGNSLYGLLRQHVEDDPPCPRLLRPDIPRNLEMTILKALAKDPRARQQSAEELSAQLWHCTRELPANAWAPLRPKGDSHAATSPAEIVEATLSHHSVRDARNSEPPAVLSYTKSVPGEKYSEVAAPRRGMSRAMILGITFLASTAVGALVWLSQEESASPEAAKRDVSPAPPPRIGHHDAAPVDSLASNFPLKPTSG